LTYDAVGATTQAGWADVDGFRSASRTAHLGEGQDRWAFATEAVLRWGVKTRSGFTVEDSDGTAQGAQPVTVGQRCWLVVGASRGRVREPVEVVSVIKGPHLVGFAYGTLTGHPLSGEEAFLVERHRDGSVWLTVRSITRPAPGIWAAADPLVHLAQQFYRRRYMRALAGPL
jgi:uncharacterized protein (UPF0548 family)